MCPNPFGCVSMCLVSTPCPSFPWSFPKHQGKPQKHQGFLSPGEPLKTLENKQKTPKKTKEFPQQEKDQGNTNTKEKKDRAVKHVEKPSAPFSAEPASGSEIVRCPFEVSGPLSIHRLIPQEKRIFPMCKLSGPFKRRGSDWDRFSGALHSHGVLIFSGPPVL